MISVIGKGTEIEEGLSPNNLLGNKIPKVTKILHAVTIEDT